MLEVQSQLLNTVLVFKRMLTCVKLLTSTKNTYLNLGWVFGSSFNQRLLDVETTIRQKMSLRRCLLSRFRGPLGTSVEVTPPKGCEGTKGGSNTVTRLLSLYRSGRRRSMRA